MTGAGYIMVIVNALLAILFFFLFEEPPQQPSFTRKNSPVSQGNHGIQAAGDDHKYAYSKLEDKEDAELPQESGRASTDRDYSQPVFSMNQSSMHAVKIVLIQRAGWFCLLISFLTGFQLTALETALTPITKEQYGWGTQQNSFLFAGITFVAIIAVVTTIVLDKQSWWTSRKIIALAQIFLGIGVAVALISCGGEDVPLWGLLTFGGFLIFGLMLQGSPSLGVYSTLIGSYDKGVFMGYSQIVMGNQNLHEAHG
eukprot:CAMPEP_0167769196 /NCGR_PEP_ID=MMETSP0110_2-20121227/17160_1 /TAXON_ID=629695 /ORGANISM="Gymnochlora sp., Strain CCMP2014" /LENGTH=254 /DNA_ID=CAMNT_0007658097 /DNA_START=504 /DNA_END=1268 /DNA_ORIENTATION=-